METKEKKPRSDDLNASSIGILWSNWCDLIPAELLELILKKLSFVDILRFKAVASPWRVAANSYNSSLHYTPFLMLPSDREDETHSRCFYSLADDKSYKIKNVFRRVHRHARWVGSSYGWLIIADEYENPSMLNPFSGARIILPLTETLLDPVTYQECRTSKDILISETRIKKAILVSAPFRSRRRRFTVVMMYRFPPSRLAYYKLGDGKWTDMGGDPGYDNISYHNGKLYALRCKILEVWDFNKPFPTKVSSIETFMPTLILEAAPVKNCYGSSYYVESLGELLYVYRISRYIEGIKNIVQKFFLFKLNFDEKRWEVLENMSGRALFIDRHQIIAVSARDFPECEENSIYFAGGPYDHPSAFEVYNLKNNVVKPFYQWGCHTSIYQPPFWVVPNV